MKTSNFKSNLQMHIDYYDRNDNEAETEYSNTIYLNSSDNFIKFVSTR
jgi:hypothetical protein